MDVFLRDPGLDLRVEHSHGWGENSQVGFPTLISMKQKNTLISKGGVVDLPLISMKQKFSHTLISKGEVIDFIWF